MRWIFKLPSIIAVAGIIASCGGGGGSSSNTGATQQNAQQTQPKIVEKMYYSYLHSTGYPNLPLSKIVQEYPCHVKVNFDDTLPENEKKYFLNFHKKLCSVLEYLTGSDPKFEFSVTYDPEGHPSWNHNITQLHIVRYPSKDFQFHIFYTIELAHIFLLDAGVSHGGGKYGNAIRPIETLSQVMTSVVAYYYGKDLGFNDSERVGFAVHLDPYESCASENIMRTLNPHSIYQTDSNYDLNVTSLNFSIHQILALFYADPNFFRNLFSIPWVGPDELKQAMANSVTTIPTQQTLKYLNNIPYFKQFEIPRPDRNIEVLPFSDDLRKLIDSRVYPTECYPVGHVQELVVIGQSNSPSIDPWSYQPDPSIFGQKAKIIVDGKQSYNTIVSSRTDRNRINVDLANGIHTINATAITDNGTYTDNITIPNGLYITTDTLPIGKMPLKVTFDIKSKFAIDHIDWDFNGDGIVDKTTNSLKVSHIYSNPGIYKPLVAIHTEKNKQATIEAPIVIVKK